MRRARRLPGGIATATDALVLAGPRGERAELVLRRWLRPGWATDDPEATPQREIAVLGALATSGLPVARVVAVDPDGSVSGVPCVLQTRLPGRMPGRRGERAPAVVRAMAETLVAIHALDDTLRPLVPDYAPYVELERLAPTLPPPGSGGAARWRRALDAVAGPPPPGPPPVSVHRDYHPGNVLVTGSRVSGVVDWAGAARGPAVTDLAHWRANLATWHGVEVADAARDAYAAAGGDLATLPWWDVRVVLDFVSDLEPAGLPGLERYLDVLLDRL